MPKFVGPFHQVKVSKIGTFLRKNHICWSFFIIIIKITIITIIIIIAIIIIIISTFFRHTRKMSF